VRRLGTATFAFVVALTVPLTAQPIADQLRAAQQLAWQKRFQEAERAYRDILMRNPHSRAAAVGLGQVLLWEQRFDEAAAVYRQLLRSNANDGDARKGLATAEYWSGDFRSARRDYLALLQQRPDDADARKAIADIDDSSAPLVTARTSLASDDQPMHRTAGEVAYTAFSDPLTKWTTGVAAMHADAATFRSANVLSVALSGDSFSPRSHLRGGATIRLFRFPDGRAQPLGRVRVEHESLSFAIERAELLDTASSLLAHPHATTATAAWTRTSRDASSFAALHATRYFDGNHGAAADAYHLVPINSSFSAGVSAAYRNTDESRFRLIGSSSTLMANDSFRYSYVARYEPYWTPRRLVESRAIVAATIHAGHALLYLHADGGIARDRVSAFGPAFGTTPLPPLFAAPAEFGRTFHPWRLSANATFHATPQIEMTIGAEHQTTVFYSANAIRFALTRRL